MKKILCNTTLIASILMLWVIGSLHEQGSIGFLTALFLLAIDMSAMFATGVKSGYIEL